ncbi:hypothetical protein GQ43DRAFT_463341 [Delitschia confertaspora ATCC 74209]|uniref:Spherulation-specific family 4 n=1 Tax=Delitschia confertaspora ATCC 74209 TaxID=1513339 RepID=A0A9P4MYU7_9PLEO|nr:hypothetical protein GQ43DRAFT_463341 [Delitschia confertaspora ATCC 74209]
MSVILPLYVYPWPGQWDPLYTAAKKHPSVDFTVIINPCSGSCTGNLPDQYYQSEIPKLKTYRNIRTLGYVATNYTNKAIEEVLEEVQTYAEWGKHSNNTKLRVDGIFFDETPTDYSDKKYRYLQRAAGVVRNATSFRDQFVVHNPGNIPLAPLTTTANTANTYLNLADITVVFEQTFEKWVSKDNFDQLRKLKVRRSKLAVMVHSLPESSTKLLEWVVDSLSEMAGHYFITTVKETDAYYSSFSTAFQDLARRKTLAQNLFVEA